MGVNDDGPTTQVTADGLMDETWILLQTKAFLAWANSHLIKKDLEAKTLDDLAGNCLVLISLIEVLSSKKFDLRYEKKPKSRIQFLINANACFDWLEANGIKLVSFSAETYIDGNAKLTLALLWGLIRKFQILAGGDHDGEGGSGSGAGASLKADLLAWVREVTAASPYELNVTNFTSSWKDGLAFSALVHFTNNDLLDYDSLDEDAVVHNLEQAFDVANTELQIPKLLSPEDVNAGLIDEHVVMTYVSYFRNAAAIQHKLKSKLMEEKGHSDELQQQLAQAVAEAERLQQELDALALARDQLQSRYDGECGEHGETRDARDAAMAERDDLSGRLADLEETTTEQLEQARKHIQELEKQLASMTSERDALVAKSENLEAENHKLKELMDQSSDEQGRSLAAMTEKAGVMERNYLEYKAKYEDADAEVKLLRGLLDDLKINVEKKLLVFADGEAAEKEATAKLRSRLQEVRDTLSREEARIPKLEASVKATAQQIKEITAELEAQKGKKDKKLVEKLQEAEMLNYQDSQELIMFRNLRSILEAEQWTTETQIVRNDKRRAFELGEEINQRMDIVAKQYNHAIFCIEKMRQANRHLQVDYQSKSHQVDDVFALMKGDLLLKYNARALGKPHKRFFFVHLFRDPVIFWSDKDTLAGGSSGLFKSDDFKQSVIHDVTLGPSDEVVKTHALTPEIQALSFSIYTADRRLDLIAPTPEIYTLWTEGLLKALDDYQKGFIGAGTGARMRVELVLAKSLGGANFNMDEQRKKFEAEQKKQDEDTKRALNELKYSIKKAKKSASQSGGLTADSAASAAADDDDDE